MDPQTVNVSIIFHDGIECSYLYVFHCCQYHYIFPIWFLHYFCLKNIIKVVFHELFSCYGLVQTAEKDVSKCEDLIFGT